MKSIKQWIDGVVLNARITACKRLIMDETITLSLGDCLWLIESLPSLSEEKREELYYAASLGQKRLEQTIHRIRIEQTINMVGMECKNDWDEQ